MKIVIDIPEDVYKRTVFNREFKDLSDCVTTIKSLANGTPLQKGHGRLIDADAFKKYIIKGFEEMKSQFKTEFYLDIAARVTESFLEDIDEQPTVESQPNRCDSCIYSEESNGSNCYECVKGMGDNFEAQQTDKCKGCYYNDGETHAECVVCDKDAQPTDAKQDCEHCIHTYGTLGCCDMVNNEWVYDCDFGKEQYKKEHEAQSTDAVSREQALLALTGMDLPTDRDKLIALFTNRIQHLPPVQSQPCEDCISREAVDALIDELARAISDERCFMSRGRSTADIMQDILDLPSVTPQRPKGKWIKVITDKDDFGETWHFKCSICGVKSNKGYRPLENYCHNCGAEMEVQDADSD